MSFPKARENALKTFFENNKEFSKIISSPNNILGIEYLKALKKYNSNIKPISITRDQSNHNTLDITNNITSSTKIRDILKNEKLDKIKNLVPSTTYTYLQEAHKNNNLLFDLSPFEKIIIYKIRNMSLEDIKNIPDVSEGLENIIKNSSITCTNLQDMISKIKSKRYTSSRIQRILLYILLDVKKSDIKISKENIPYIRILGFNKKGNKLLSKIAKENPNLQIITSVKKFKDNNTNNDLNNILEKDIFATNVYTLGYNNISFGNLDFTEKIRKFE